MRDADYTILAIDPGSTSTKIAVFKDQDPVFEKTIRHSLVELDAFPSIMDQKEPRKTEILAALADAGFGSTRFDAVVGRGGVLPPVKSGAYRVNAAMLERLMKRPVVEHAANLGAILAHEIAEESGAPSFIYDSISVDELSPVARLSGLAGLDRKSLSHALNSRAVAMRCAESLGRPYSELNLIVAHVGGGASVSLHSGGRIVDLVLDDEGPFSAGKSGGLPAAQLVDMIFDEDLTRGQAMKRLRGSGGLISYLGTDDLREAERRAASGDARADLVLDALAYQISKAIASLSSVVRGNVDRILFTGGAARSERLAKAVTEAVSFLAPVEVMPGEEELSALARGALRVLRGTEEAREYVDPETSRT